jgi:type IV secretory pathway VirB2 component (pilin)
MKEKFDIFCWKALFWAKKHSKEIALALVLIGVLLITTNLFAQSGVEGEFSNFGQTLKNILVGPVAKTLAVGCFIGAGVFFMLGKIGIAIGCIVGGIFLGFAERIAEAVFR